MRVLAPAFPVAMEIAPSRLREAERSHGAPREAYVRQEVQLWEMDLLERVCGETRFHDVTVFIRRDHSLALVHKPSDPPGAFWAPAGAVEPGETLSDGARREALEETGLEIKVERYVLRLQADFWCGERTRPWLSHVFLASGVGMSPEPVDVREVESAAWVTLRDFRTEVVPILRASGWGRYQYRLHMADLVFRELGLDPLEEAAGGTA